MQHTSVHKNVLKGKILSKWRGLSPKSESKRENCSGENSVEKIQHEKEEQLKR